jgi:outer membrane receptor protein involved in Fe transport
MNLIFRRNAPSSLMVKRALIAGASALAMGLASGAHAQPAEEIAGGAEADAATEDRVVVTGSRIRRPVDQTIAVTEIGAAEFETRAFTNTIDSLEELPFVGVGTNNSGNGTQTGDNNAFVNLLGFGTNRTLTLIDGRRIVSANQGTVFVPGNVTGTQVDLTIINPALIKSTEIQTVGSGPIYGADAVAGVVNVILDREFTGFEATAQGGITQHGDGEEFRVAGAWGKKLFGGRGHLILAGEYFDSNGIYGDAENRPFSQNGIGGGATIGTTTLQQQVFNVLSANGADGIPDEVFINNVAFRNQQLPATGLIALGRTNSGSTNNFNFPDLRPSAASGQRPAFDAFVAATGLSPYDFAIANPGVNPLLFAGTFGLTSGFLTVPNTDPATAAFLPRLAVPLTFGANGDARPYNVGDLLPPNLSDQNSIAGGEGFNEFGQNTIRAGQERISLNSLWSYELTPSVRYEGDLWYSRIENVQRANASPAQTPAGSITAGNAGLPIFIDENPFVTAGTRAQLDAIAAANGGPYFSSIGGSRFFALYQTLFDIAGGLDDLEGNTSTTWRTSHVFEGEFDAIDREFYWDLAFAYSRNKSENEGQTDVLDIEFALATDVVDIGAGPQCRQQTLAAPESVGIRNPGLAAINIATPGGLVPTQAQIDACVPLNLFGGASQAAIDYVLTESESANLSQQWYAAASIGGDVVQLPAGPWKFNWQVEFRQEELLFTPNDVFLLGTARATTGQAGEGTARFIEGGNEFNVPIFGGDVRPFAFNLLEFDGAVRVVHRSGQGTPGGLGSPPVDVASSTDVTFTAGGRWSPFEGVTFRGNKTRAVRSPSIVESLGAAQTGFSGLSAAFPCNAVNRNGGPTSGIRLTNCDAFEASLGLPAGTFAGLNPPAVAVPASVVGNPNLTNEISNNWTVGVVLQPDFIPGLTITSDYVSLFLRDQIALAFNGGSCFDDPAFPETLVGGLPVCDALVLAVANPANPSQFIIPSDGINIITGRPNVAAALAGSLAPAQSPFSIAAARFDNANAGLLLLNAINSSIRYSFDINDVVGGDLNLGNLTLFGNVYYIRKYDASATGDFATNTNPLRGEPGNEEIQTRLDVTHRIGRLTHSLQWSRLSDSEENVIDTAPLDEEPDHFRPVQNFFNYSVAYEINDNFTARLVVNNLTDTQFLPEFGISSPFDNGIGRSFIFAINARF